jgi:acyl-CoA thioesterase-1
VTLIIFRYLGKPLRVLISVGFLFAGHTLSSADLKGPVLPSILILGDSISAAYGIPVESGWVALLRERLRNLESPYQAINASVSGETSAGGLRRLPRLLKQYSPKIVILELGGNDGLRGYPIGQLRKNLASIVTTSVKSGAEVLVLPMEIPPNMGRPYTTAFRHSFNLVAMEHNARLGKFPLEDVALNGELMQADGIHPTKEAQSLILETIWLSLEDML